MLTVITPAASHALTTVDAAKADLGLPGGGDDAYLGALIDRASDTITAWCGRTFARETVRETFRSGCPLAALSLARWPVSSLTSVTVGGAVLELDRVEVESGTGILHRLDATGYRLPWRAEVTVVTYAAGYVLPGAAGRDLPADIEAACLALVRLAYHRRGADPLLKAATLGETKLDFYSAPLGAEDGVPAEVGGMLFRHRAVWVG